MSWGDTRDKSIVIEDSSEDENENDPEDKIDADPPHDEQEQYFQDQEYQSWQQKVSSDDVALIDVDKKGDDEEDEEDEEDDDDPPDEGEKLAAAAPPIIGRAEEKDDSGEYKAPIVYSPLILTTDDSDAVEQGDDRGRVAVTIVETKKYVQGMCKNMLC